MASSSGTTAQSLKDVILSDPSTFDQWYDNIRGSVPENLWRYFNTESDDVYDEPIAPVRPVNEPPPDQNEAPQSRKARADRNKDAMEIFYKEFGIHEFERRKWAKYLDVEAELRDRIQATVAHQKKAKLRATLTVRDWLTDLKALTALPLRKIKQNIQFEYRRLMDVGLAE